MPPKSKRARQSLQAGEKGREAQKKAKLKAEAGENVAECTQHEHTTASASESAATLERSGPLSESTISTAAEPEVTPDTHTPNEIIGDFVDGWVRTLDRDDRQAVAMLLCSVLVSELSFTVTNAAELTSKIIHKTERTVRQWRTDLIHNGGDFPESKQGKYHRSGVLWSNEELNKKASEYVRANAAVKGAPNMTTTDFCKWVNKTLLPNFTLEPEFPRKVSVETAHTWLHHLGFEVLTPKKGHEHLDVIASCETFLRKMVKIGFLHFTNASTEEAQKAIPADIDAPTLERHSKTVVFCHDESTFQANDDQSLQWGEKGTKMMKPKSKGAGIMVSDFIDE